LGCPNLSKGKQMKPKTQKLINFIEKLHEHIVRSPLLRKKVQNKNESQIQTELRPIIFEYMIKHFQNQNWQNPVNGATKYLYWEGEERKYTNMKTESFASRNYPDYIITNPYKIAIEYKKSGSGSIVKHGIGQSIMHTMGGEFDFVYCLIHDESKNKKMLNSTKNEKEKIIIQKIREDYNVFMKFI
jgi:hypothetical protein